MNVRGLLPFSLLDYPGKISAVVFVGGCNLHCPFCHNPCLVLDPQSQPQITEFRFFTFLESRKNLLDGIVFSGGEPTIYDDLPTWMTRVKSLGFSVKLDTNGTRPEMIARLLQKDILDAAGVDYKMPAEKYGMMGTKNYAAQVHESLSLLLAAGIPLDVRTTVHPALLRVSDLRQMRRELNLLGIQRWTLQQFHVVDTLDAELPTLPAYSNRELTQISRELGDNVHVRGL